MVLDGIIERTASAPNLASYDRVQTTSAAEPINSRTTVYTVGETADERTLLYRALCGCSIWRR